jgi:hypothetical protein
MAATRDYRVELVEDGGINPEARSMDVERPEDKLPPAKSEDVFRNIEQGLKEVRVALVDGNKIRAKVQFASVKTLISIGNSIAMARNDASLKQKLDTYKATLDELEQDIIMGTIPQPLTPIHPVKYCSDCGKIVESDDRFCSECGVPQ